MANLHITSDGWNPGTIKLFLNNFLFHVVLRGVGLFKRTLYIEIYVKSPLFANFWPPCIEDPILWLTFTLVFYSGLLNICLILESKTLRITIPSLKVVFLQWDYITSLFYFNSLSACLSFLFLYCAVA